MTRDQRPQPRTYFLNEAHQLAPYRKEGGGAVPKYEGISWQSRGRQISASLKRAVKAVEASRDPIKERRYFVLAKPVPELKKRRETKTGELKEIYTEKTDFGGDHNRIFDRLGLDLLQVTETGKAIVHGSPETIEKLSTHAGMLEDLGQREQARWATIESFDTIPLQLRVDSEWIDTLRADSPSDIIIELQPVLTSAEADEVLRALTDLVLQRRGENLTGTGIDFSGRHWLRGRASLGTIRAIAREFYSVQTLHPPYYSIAADGKRIGRSSATYNSATPPPSANSQPCVGIVDLGIPADHKQLAPYRRGQFRLADAPPTPVGDHGTFVSSRAVFGDHPNQTALLQSVGRCSFYDIVVAAFPQGSGRADLVNDKLVLESLRGAKAAAQDVRVFNLSFGDSRPLGYLPPVEAHEKKLDIQHLDNFVFQTDSIVIVSSGNSVAGVIPSPQYPNHESDKRWALGPWACGFNTLVCGSFVSQLTTHGLVKGKGWPSPFTRIGPGIADGPVPSFGAPGGNGNANFTRGNGLGVLGFSNSGLVEDRAGTSFSAPILAREVALTVEELQKYCIGGAQPFGVTVRAFLTLTAQATTADPQVQELARRSLGYGQAQVERLIKPKMTSAVVLWQGYVESPSDVVRVQLPVPIDWLKVAQTPKLRLVVCSDPPVNQAAKSNWACRRIRPVLHPGPDQRGLTAPRGGHYSYPVIDRTYDLSQYGSSGDKEASSDLWVLEISYEEIAAYPLADFDPRQRVAFAAELFDDSANVSDPHSAMQALPAAASMTRLALPPAVIRSPIIIPNR